MEGSKNTLRRGLLLALSYFVSAFASLEVALVEEVVTPIWPPTGVALVCLLIWGRRYWPWVTVAALAVNLPRTPTFAVAAAVAAGNTLAPLVAVTLLRRARFDPDFRRMRDALALVFLGALASMTVSATIGTFTLLQAGAIAPREAAGTWSVWWAGDALGILVFAPLILSFRARTRPDLSTPGRRVEAAAVLLLTVLAASRVFQLFLPVRYLVFPLLAWAALRFGILGAATGTLIVTAFAVASVVAGTDPLAGDGLLPQMLSLQLLNATVALTTFVLAASSAIRHRTAAELRTETQDLESAVKARTAELESTMEELEKEVASRALSESVLEEKQRQLNEAESLAHVGSWSWDIVTDTISWSDELFRIYGLEKQDARLAYEKYLTLQHPEARDQVAAKVREALEHGTPYRIDHRIFRPDGEMRWVRGQGRAVMGPHGAIRLFGAAQDITEQKLAEDRLRESEERFRGLVEQAPEAILVMDLDSRTFVEVNRAGEELLGRSRDELIGMSVLRAIAPRQPDGRASSDLGREIIQRVLAGQTPQFEWLFLHKSGREVLCEVRLFYLPAGGRRLVRGSVVDITERRRMETVLQEAREKERQLEEQRQIAQSLQRSLLPEKLPELPGVKLAVRYLPGSEGLEVGGDWYDAFDLPGDGLALVLGDIVGRGLQAATNMGQLRTALRAYALADPSPRAVLRQLGNLVDSLLDAEMATVVYAVYERDTGTLTYSSAGHPPPLLLSAEGEAAYLTQARSAPLGIPDLTFSEATVTLEPGSVLLLYTDGLVERRGVSIDEGLEALAQAARDAAQSKDLEELTSRILDAMHKGEALQDDTALLTMQVTAARTAGFTFSGPAEPESLTELRHSFSRWLSGKGASREELQDLVLAVTEAAGNAVLHAYGPGEGTFEVEAGENNSLVSVGVTDQGRWRTRRPSIGGRGLNLMRALVQSVQIHSDGTGTRVKLRRHLGRPLPEPELADGPAPAPPPADGRREDLVAVVRVTEEIDVNNAQQIGASLLKELGHDKLGMVLDLTELEFLESSGLGMLVQLSRRLQSRRMQLRVVVSENSLIHRILMMADVQSILSVSSTVEEAVDTILTGEGL